MLELLSKSCLCQKVRDKSSKSYCWSLNLLGTRYPGAATICSSVDNDEDMADQKNNNEYLAAQIDNNENMADQIDNKEYIANQIDNDEDIFTMNVLHRWWSMAGISMCSVLQ